MDSINPIISVLSEGTAIAVLIASGWFVAFRLWPWFVERDAEQRKRSARWRDRELTNDAMLIQSLNIIGEKLSGPINVVIKGNGTGKQND